MKRIEMGIWKPKAEDPRYVERVGQRSGLEVFRELKQRLDSMGMLPDEYFKLDGEWKEGKPIPENAEVFVNTNYGSSEGIYIDGYLKWYQDGEPITKSFFTGKTLGETGADLDRMFLISSAITKAFYGDGGQYARYQTLHPEENAKPMLLSLSPAEHQLFVEALVEHRERMKERMDGSEQLLRRMVGNITEYMSVVGERPIHLSDYDRTALAVRDDDLPAFKELFPRVMVYADRLLVDTASHAGNVGRKMTLCLLAGVKEFESDAYLTASRQAVELDDAERVKFLMEQAAEKVRPFQKSYYGEVIRHAVDKNEKMALSLVKWCPAEWIEAAPPDLLYRATFRASDNYRLMDELMRKGVPCEENAWKILNTLTSGRDAWIAERLLRDGMRVADNDFGALDACVRNGAVACGKLLLDRGMDYEQYVEWTSERSGVARKAETMDELKSYWQSIHPQEQVDAPDQEAPQLGGMTM